MFKCKNVESHLKTLYLLLNELIKYIFFYRKVLQKITYVNRQSLSSSKRRTVKITSHLDIWALPVITVNITIQPGLKPAITLSGCENITVDLTNRIKDAGHPLCRNITIRPRGSRGSFLDFVTINVKPAMRKGVVFSLFYGHKYFAGKYGTRKIYAELHLETLCGISNIFTSYLVALISPISLISLPLLKARN